jgi:thiosulfate/3-mercaptopyruvate sulfurtransferase
LQLFGHTNSRVLDYGKEQWRNDGRAWTTCTTLVAPTSYSLKNEDPRLRADMARVGQAIGDPSVVLLDVRGQAEYDGACFWPSGGSEPGGRQGHIPSARHQPIDDVHDQMGVFQPRERLQQLLGAVPDDFEHLISYCTIGGRACTAWFVLTYLLGRENVCVYDGSWAEWGRALDTAVA